MTEQLAVIGDPIQHSLSPAMQTAALQAAGLNWTYRAQRVSVQDLSDWVQIARSRYRGFNVTVPHKCAALDLVDVLAASAEDVGAINTVENNHGRLVGHNTDVAGFEAALRELRPGGYGFRALVFGAGGAARAVLAVLRTTKASAIVVNRDLDRAQLLVERALGVRALSFTDIRLAAEIEAADLIVNATSLGMMPLSDRSPLPPAVRLRASTTVMDLVYGGVTPTPLLAMAMRAGCRVADGRAMLVHQGAEAFRLWTGRQPDLDVMRAACGLLLTEGSAC